MATGKGGLIGAVRSTHLSLRHRQLAAVVALDAVPTDSGSAVLPVLATLLG